MGLIQFISILNSSSIPTQGGGGEDWILTDGVWNDSFNWDDEQNWID